MKFLRRKYLSLTRWLPALILWALGAALGGCSTAATTEGMIPTSFETVNAHAKTVRVSVTGGQESVALGKPQITNGDFTQALVVAIGKSRTFAKVIEDKNQGADYLLTVTLFSLDTRVFGRRFVKLEAGWTLRHGGSGTIVWQESILSEDNQGDVIAATEAAARNNIANGLAKISKLKL